MTPTERLASLQAADAAGQRLKVLPFWGHRPNRDGSVGIGCLSQWWPAPFRVEGIRYPTAERTG